MKVLIIIIFLLSPKVFADAKVDKIGKVFVEEYVKKQVQKKLESFLNRNPEILFSGSPSAGTTMMKWVGRALSVHQLITAQNDKQRLLAAANLIISPEPTTAMILIAVQVADMVISMQHQSNIAKINEETMRLELEAMKILKEIVIQDYTYQAGIVNGLMEKANEINRLHGEIINSPATLFFIGTSGAPPAALEMEELFGNVSELHRLIVDFQTLEIMYNAVVEKENLDLLVENIDGLYIFSKTLLTIKKEVEPILKTVRTAFAHIKGQDRYQKLTLKREKRKQKLNTYLRCSRLMNESITQRHFGNSQFSNKNIEFIENCQSVLIQGDAA